MSKQKLEQTLQETGGEVCICGHLRREHFRGQGSCSNCDCDAFLAADADEE